MALFPYCPSSLLAFTIVLVVFALSPESQEEGFGEDSPFTMECSSVSHSQHIVQLWVYIDHLLQEEVSQMMTE